MNELARKNQQKIATYISIDLKATGDKHLGLLIKKKHRDHVIPSDPKQKMKQLVFHKGIPKLVVRFLFSNIQFDSKAHKREKFQTCMFLASNIQIIRLAVKFTRSVPTLLFFLFNSIQIGRKRHTSTIQLPNSLEECYT